MKAARFESNHQNTRFLETAVGFFHSK